jgi:hypothetical protein
MLDAVPDLRDELRNATPEELADLLGAFDVTATYDKETTGSILLPPCRPNSSLKAKNSDRLRTERQGSRIGIAGGRYGPISDPIVPIEWAARWPLMKPQADPGALSIVVLARVLPP